jgi:transcriptional regulator with XRE-family HTH domain
MTIAIRCRSYQELMQTLAARRRQLGMTQLEVDDKAGFQDQYCGKLEIGTRRVGPMSLPTLLQTLGVELLVTLPPDAAPIEHAGSCAQAERTERRALPVTGEM